MDGLSQRLRGAPGLRIAYLFTFSLCHIGRMISERCGTALIVHVFCDLPAQEPVRQRLYFIPVLKQSFRFHPVQYTTAASPTQEGREGRGQSLRSEGTETIRSRTRVLSGRAHKKLSTTLASKKGRFDHLCARAAVSAPPGRPRAVRPSRATERDRAKGRQTCPGLHE